MNKIEMLNKKLIFPPRKGKSENEPLECSEAVVIIGANGSGKSRLGRWIEEHQESSQVVHRISAQRNLDFSEYVSLTSIEKANNELLFGMGTIPQSWGELQTKKIQRWKANQRPELSVTPMLDDYDKVLSLLFAKENNRNSEYVHLVREMQNKGNYQSPTISDSPIDVIQRIWKDILPHRKLVIKNDKVTAAVSAIADFVLYLLAVAKLLNSKYLKLFSFYFHTLIQQRPISNSDIYHGREMSDGERVALYLMAQCLCAPKDSILIIDEPEIHLHKSLMNKLWSEIEAAQPTCLFIYITHDLDFAASRIGAKKILVKSYDGQQWNWDEIPKSENLPEPVLLEILGSRKTIVFVEGDKGSLDYQIYSAIYPHYLIVPRGSCDKVIESTKAMRDNSEFHHIKAFGVIDMDYRTEDEIKALKKSGIKPLNVAEIENILCVPELLEIVANNLGFNYEEIEQEVLDFVIDIISKNIEYQCSKRSSAEIEFKLNMFDAKAKGKDQLSVALKGLCNSINISDIYDKNLAIYNQIIQEKDYKKALLYYNNKGLSKSISKFFEVRDYSNHIIRLLSTENKEKIISALKQYAPIIDPT
ncbi:MAG: AAA family ATPase [Okeania sp. SIO2D1]|nr:AAA family ATPase [Okeania sp. SIO2D1]